MTGSRAYKSRFQSGRESVRPSRTSATSRSAEAVKNEVKMSTNRLMYALLFLTVVAVNVDSICWNCMPENMSDEEIDTILADDFKRRILKKLGLTEEQIVAKNESTDLPLEIVNDLVADDEEEIKQDDGEGLLKSVILEALNNGRFVLKLYIF